MKYIIQIKRESSIGLTHEKYKSYILYPYKSTEAYTQELIKAWPFDNETDALDYISSKVIMDAEVLPITQAQYIDYLERGKQW